MQRKYSLVLLLIWKVSSVAFNPYRFPRRAANDIVSVQGTPERKGKSGIGTVLGKT